MKRVALIMIVTLVVIAAMAVAIFAETQQEKQKAAKSKQPDLRKATANRLEQMAQRLSKQMKLNEAEAVVVMPVVKELIGLRYKEMPKLQRLRVLQRKKKATDQEINTVLRKFRENLRDARARIGRAEQKLIAMDEMTPRRQLILTIHGVLDNGTGFRLMPAARVTQRKATLKEVRTKRKAEKEKDEGGPAPEKEADI